jgi:hypothetical protein
MKPHARFAFCLIIFIAICLPRKINAQSIPDFVSAGVFFNDSTQKTLVINEYQFLKFGVLRNEENKDLANIEKVHHVKIGLAYYFVRHLENKVLVVEQVIGGTISLYSIPAKLQMESGLFAEKGDVFKELKVYKRYVTQSTYQVVAEYQSILSFFFHDCKTLTPVDKIPFTEQAIATEIYNYNSRCGKLIPIETEVVHVVYNDSTEKQIAIDTQEFFKSKRFVTHDSLELPGIENVHSVSIGTNTYFIKQFEGEIKILEQIVAGSINLYRIASLLDETGLYAEKGTLFKTLRVYRKGSIEIPEYRSILSFLFLGCENPEINVDRIKFNEQAIAKAIQSYNAKCGFSNQVKQPVNNEVQLVDSPTEKKSSKASKEFALLGGIAHASVLVDTYGRLTSTSKMPLNRAFVGASFHVSMAKLSGLGLKQSLTFEKIKNEISVDKLPDTQLPIRSVTYDFLELRYSLIADYLIRTKGAVSFGVGIGGTFNLELADKSTETNFYYIKRNGAYEEFRRSESPLNVNSEKLRFSPVGELKVRYKRFELGYQHLTAAHYKNSGPSAKEKRIFLSWRITR